LKIAFIYESSSVVRGLFLLPANPTIDYYHGSFTDPENGAYYTENHAPVHMVFSRRYQHRDNRVKPMSNRIQPPITAFNRFNRSTRFWLNLF